MEDQAGRTRLATMLKVCFDGLKVYGKEPDQLDNANKLFCLVLADYHIEQIESALKYYLKHNNEFPAPADIANIIERGNKPPLDKTVYVSISKKYAEDRTDVEWEYMKDYEEFMLRG